MIKIENGLLENTKEINEYDETYAYEKKNNNMNKRRCFVFFLFLVIL